MEEISKNIDKLCEEFQRLSIGPNWCDMPAEIKFECIKRLKLKERLLLRSTARAERRLVDSSKKLKIPYFSYFHGQDESQISYGENSEIEEKFHFPHSQNQPIPVLKRLLGLAKFQNFRISSHPEFWVTRGFENPKNGWEIEKIRIEQCCLEDLHYWMSNLNPESIREIRLDGDLNYDKLQIDDILDISNVTNCKFLQISNYYHTESIKGIAQTWIDNDAKVGSIFQVQAMEYGTISEFLVQFSDRIVWASPKMMRIRTDNRKKHILLDLGHSETIQDQIGFIRITQFIRIQVIGAKWPVGPEKWERTLKWMRDLDPKFEFPAEEQIVDF
ncbi:hypothetical protein B9Z55_003472 [Caenorhabditis nigoni]|uniref:F-box domain-containing protein n=1 Tax=Caenorhabditis nigoni TaxID=1611254 RepID=A0A2G5VQF1_9PELO|nr:hypothetical protein B9Z55_003472 [Caenorhabditis nigoni]